MKKTMKKGLIILAGISLIFAAGSAMAGDVVNVGGVEISKADFMDVKARVAGEPAGDRVFAKKVDAVNVGGIELARADVEKVKAIVAGNASVADAAVYAQAPDMVDLGPVAVEKAMYDGVKEAIGNGPAARLAKGIRDGEVMN